jgi:hypothetical protein
MRFASVLLSTVCFGFLGGCSLQVGDAPPSHRPRPIPAPDPTPIAYSSDLDVAQIDADVEVVADAEKILVTASLLYGPTELHLDEGDVLTAKVGGLELTLTEQPHVDDSVRYAVAFPPYAEPGSVSVRFLRRAGRAEATGSLVTVPAPFTITGAPPKALARGDALNLSTSRVLEAPSLAFKGPCLASVAPVSLTSGPSLTFDTSGLVVSDGFYGCTVQVEVRTGAPGALDPAFHGGKIAAFQARSFELSLAK